MKCKLSLIIEGMDRADVDETYYLYKKSLYSFDLINKIPLV